jgi:hypothetical protein
MQRSEFKLLQEIYSSLNEGRLNMLDKADKNKIHHKLKEYGLDGQGRFGSPTFGVQALSNALDDAGFHLDMVSGGLLGEEGHRQLSFRRFLDTIKDSEGEEHPQIENSYVHFEWTKLGEDEKGNPKYEILCYLT